MKNATGFHVLELIISVAIISILVQLTVPAFNGPRDKLNQAEMLSNLLNIQLALELCYTQKGSYLECKKELLPEYKNHIRFGTADSYVIEIISKIQNTDCYRWVLNDVNELTVYNMQNVVAQGCYIKHPQ